MSRDISLLQGVSLAALALFWALNWPAMKVGLGTVEPWTFRLLTVAAGGVGALLIARGLGQRLIPHSSDRRALLLLAFVQATLWNGFSGFGIALGEAGRAALIAFTMPIWATLLAVLILGETVGRRRALGLAVGLGGIVVLMAPALGGLAGQREASLFMLAAAVAWGAGTVIFKAQAWQTPILVVTGWHFLIGGIPLLVAAFALGEPASLLEVDLGTGLVVAYSALIPMILCQYIWFRLVQAVPANVAAMATLAVPGLGLAASAVLLGEPVGPFEVAGLVLLTVAMVLILTSFSLRANRHPPPAPRPE
ncbi:MAG: DMT family transporter [Geminicoccaceae bacterium]|nr:MAG: DMT family transporter [Geminicoccaceae bacterium]